ncbi:MAG TPA: DNA polymerase III subunit alpha [Caulobacterales bacterium]|nr:DNA polymerase III subunit alpha [Caulobacterales bacterium]
MSKGPASDLFVHLRGRSAYSLLESALHVKELAALAKARHMPALALTDSNNLFGALEFSEVMAEKGIQPIVGLALSVREEGGTSGVLALLAQSEAGYANLMALSTSAYLDVPPTELPHVALDYLLARSEGLIALTGGGEGLANALIGAGRDPRELIGQLREAFPDRLYIELQRHGEIGEAEAEAALIDIAYASGLPLAATNDVRFEKREDHRAHDALMCIAASSYLGEQDRPRVSPEHYFKSAAEMRALFSDLPEAIEQSIDIARRCAFRVKKRKPILPRFNTKKGRDEAAELTAQAEEGLRMRLKALGESAAAPRKEYEERLKYELAVIIQMGFPGYFLIVADFIKWAKSKGIPVGPGRGSGAGSLVAWALTITDLDPLRFGLFFERFLNPERVSMPDFDIDFCQDRRGEVIDYVREKYGPDRVAQIITFGTLQARAVVRDVGRVMQLPFGQVDRLAKLIPANPADPVTLEKALEAEPRLKQARESEPEVDELINVALQLEGLHRNASTHAAGIVIGDRPLVELVALYRDPRSDIPATQFNMKWVEPAGLVKFDFLGLKTLTVLDRAQKLVRQRGAELDLDHIPLDDAKTFDMLARGDTVGVFQVESLGMRRALVDMQPDRFEDLIALVALYRPGPMANIPTYCARKLGREPVEHIHPQCAPILEETFGIITYQEQVMQIARDLAGYSFGEADLLRRAMGKKIREEMQSQRVRFVSGAVKRGIKEQDADIIFDACAKFADYGFNKSHSAPYALLTYRTGYMKANFPVEFLAASMSLDAGNTDKLAIFRQEARRMGVDVLPPDVNASGADFTVEGQAVRYALGAVKNVGQAAMEAVVAERERGGKFNDLIDFAERLDPKAINRRQLENLARAGAFDKLEPERARAFAACEIIAAVAARAADERASAQASLFGGGEKLARPAMPKAAAWSSEQRLDNERDSVGFYISGHPLDVVLAEAAPGKYSTYAMIHDEGETEPRAHAVIGVVRKLREITSKDGVRFGFVTLSDPTGEFEAMILGENLAHAREVLQAGKPIVCRLRSRWRDGELRLTADMFEPLEAAEARVGDDLKIVIREGAASFPTLADTLRALASARGEDARPLRLILRLDDGREVELQAKGVFPAGPSARAALKAARGVERVV